MAHGITGSLAVASGNDADDDGAVIRYVASPLDKHRYRLDTGEGLTEGDPALAVWAVRITTAWSRLPTPWSPRPCDRCRPVMSQRSCRGHGPETTRKHEWVRLWR